MQSMHPMPPTPSMHPMHAPQRDHAAVRFPAAVDAALRAAGWEPGRWDIRQAEYWADTLRGHASPGGHQHTVFPAAVDAWAEFGGLCVTPTEPGRDIAPVTVHLDPLHGLHMARTLGDLGLALGTQLAPLGQESAFPSSGDGTAARDGTKDTDGPNGTDGAHAAGEQQALLAIDDMGRVYSIDHSGDWYLGRRVEDAFTTLLSGVRPVRLTAD